MVVLLVIDMQVGLFGEATPRLDSGAIIDRINKVAMRSVIQAAA